MVCPEKREGITNHLNCTKQYQEPKPTHDQPCIPNPDRDHFQAYPPPASESKTASHVRSCSCSYFSIFFITQTYVLYPPARPVNSGESSWRVTRIYESWRITNSRGRWGREAAGWYTSLNPCYVGGGRKNWMMGVTLQPST
jgi:hypothetical protein